MATQFELQQAAEQKKAAEIAKTQAMTGAAMEATGRAIGAPQPNFFAQAINLLGGLAIGVSQFFDAKAAAKKKEKITQHQQFVITNVDKILGKLANTGIDQINSGLDPTTPEFEKALYDALFKDIGYRGNCNLTAKLPGNDKAVWFEMTNNGTILVPTRGLIDPPPNFETYWSTNCRNVHDEWVAAYQDRLIKQGRQVELTSAGYQYAPAKPGDTGPPKLVKVSNTQTLFFQVIFGLVAIILIVFFARNFMRLK